MASLDRTLRRDLENAVKKARRVAEAGARQAIEQLAVHHHEPWGALTPNQRKLRNRLRAHGRQLGDRLDERKGRQAIDRLVGECAYEHWHRLLFARFLAENDLLVEPESGMALSLDECRELARERGIDWLMLASDFAQRMLPQIFRTGDPVLEVTLPPEKRQELEAILETLPREVFIADDSLGWVYQFWQADQKEKVNKSEKKIGADELPAVTQLFTEDYMVLFLLHNTLGAWWAGKVLATHPEVAKTASSENELREACALPGVAWEYLRFVKDDDGTWRPAAGTFEGWSKAAKDITVLDPCMGSGHFLVFALPILMAFRMEEEGLSHEEAIKAVLRDNLFGLEIDPRCTQIAAFNLALAAWKLSGYRTLPPLNLACSGLGLNTKKDEWLKLAGEDTRLRQGMAQLYELFQKAPHLGSLINPRALGDNLFVAEFHDLQPLLDKALAQETDETTHELAVTARGVAKAAEILAGQFTLVATNVPYLVKGKQATVLQEFASGYCPEGAQDLATILVRRCEEFTGVGGTHATVTPQNWLFLKGYTRFRKRLLAEQRVHMVAKVGSGANATASWDVLRALVIITCSKANDNYSVIGLEATAPSELGRAEALRNSEILVANHSAIATLPDARFAVGGHRTTSLLANFADSLQGIATGNYSRFGRFFWEVPFPSPQWSFQQTTTEQTEHFSGCHQALLWNAGEGDLARSPTARIQGTGALARRGVAVTQMRSLPVALFLGTLFDNNIAVILPRNEEDLDAIWTFCSSEEFSAEVRRIDEKLGVTNATLVKVPFEVAHWRKVAAEKYPNGLPKPHSDDPTQWLFDGHPVQAKVKVEAASRRLSGQRPLLLYSGTLQVAVARLLGYRWPRQTGSSFMDCPVLEPDGLEKYADEDGIVCLMSLKGEQSAAERLRALLADAFASEWSAAKLNLLLDVVGFGDKSLEDWLRDGFFEQHCELFHQRPFVWHVWDGLKNGFGALVNYHRLCGSNVGAAKVGAASGRSALGGGTPPPLSAQRDAAATLEKLIYTYLGDWIDRQRAAQRAGVEGADARVAAAEYLKRELEKILEGEPPYDIFVRWKPLHEQSLGWEPDLNDGVRLNIRPFMTAKPLNARGKNACILRVLPKIKWDKDRGKEPGRPKDEYPWFWGWDEKTPDFLGSSTFDGNRWNDLHYSRVTKLKARERAKGGGK